MENLKRSLIRLVFALFSSYLPSFPLYACLPNDVCKPLNQCQASRSVCAGPYVELGAGWSSIKNPNGQAATTPGNLPDLYLSDNHKDSIFLAVSAGYAWFFDQAWLPAVSLGLEYSAIPQTNGTGQIEQFSDPTFINYNYKYSISREQLSLLGKLDIYRFRQFMPFILAGIGNSWNHFSGFNETALPGIFPRVSPNYSDNTKSNTSYTLGLGLDYQPLNNLIVALTYRYDDFGKINSGPGTGAFVNSELTTSHVYTNTVLLSVRYLFA